MIIQVDEEGKTAVDQLCEVAVRYLGTQLAQGGVKHLSTNIKSLLATAKIITTVKQLPFEESTEEPGDENPEDNG